MFPLRLTVRQVLDKMTDAGVLHDRAAAENILKIGHSHVPWYVHALALLGSWLAVILFLVYIIFEIRIKNSGILITIAILAGSISYVMHRAKPDSLIFQHLIIPLSLMATFVFALGAYKSHFWYSLHGFKYEPATSLVVLSEIVFFLVLSDPVRRFVAILVISFASTLFLYQYFGGVSVVVYPFQIILIVQIVAGVGLWEYQNRILNRQSLWLLPAMFASLVGFILLSLYMVLVTTADKYLKFDPSEFWLLTSVIVLLFTFVIYRIHKRTEKMDVSAASMAWIFISVIAVLTYQTPAISGVMLIAVLAYAHGSRTLFFVATISMAVFIGFYYYNMGSSLLHKAISLMISGTLALLAAAIVSRLTDGKSRLSGG